MSIIVTSNEKPATPAPEAKAEGVKEAGAPEDKTTSGPEAEASRQNASSDSETEETETTESESKDEGTPEEGETQAKEDDKEAAEPAAKKKGGFQRRIDKLNAAKSAAQQEAEYWKRLALESAGATKKDTPTVEKQAATEGKPNPDSFDTHAEFVEALTDWKTDQKLAARDQKLEREKFQSTQAKAVQTYVERKEAFSEKVSDFEDVLSEVDDIPISPALQEIILSSENGPELAYELAKNRDEYARVCKLPPLAAAREIGKIESRIAARTSEAKPENKKITKAPKPLEPVSAGGKGVVKKTVYDTDLSQADYEKLRAEHLKRRQA